MDSIGIGIVEALVAIGFFNLVLGYHTNGAEDLLAVIFFVGVSYLHERRKAGHTKVW